MKSNSIIGEAQETKPDGTELENKPKDLSLDSVAVEIRYFASAKAAAGLSTETVTLSASSNVRDVVTSLVALHGEQFARILASASFLLNGVAVRDLDVPLKLTEGIKRIEFDVLPPFAGG